MKILTVVAVKHDTIDIADVDLFWDENVKTNSKTDFAKPVWKTDIELPSFTEHKKIESQIIHEFETKFNKYLNPKYLNVVKFSYLCQLFLLTCELLYSKYIIAGVAPLEINIASQERREMKNLFVSQTGIIKNKIIQRRFTALQTNGNKGKGKENPREELIFSPMTRNDIANVSDLTDFMIFIEKYYKLFYKCNLTVQSHLAYSFTRFKRTDIYEKLAEQYKM